jgi:hypothetical protein
MILMMIVLGCRLSQKRLLSKVLNVALFLHNHRKKLMTALMQMSPPIVASNEIVLTAEYVSGGVGVADIIADVGMILGVDPHPTATVVTLSVDASFVDLEFMPEYDAVFGDEWAEDSADDRLVPEISNRDKVMLQ